MKRGILLASFLALIAFVFASCQATPRTTSHGLENVAYLQITSVKAYEYTATDEVEERTPRIVTVVVDDTEPFQAKVNDAKKRSVDNKYTYKIAVGAHDIEVRNGDTIIAKKKIFTSANEIKIVEVP